MNDQIGLEQRAGVGQGLGNEPKWGVEPRMKGWVTCKDTEFKVS